MHKVNVWKTESVEFPVVAIFALHILEKPISRSQKHAFLSTYKVQKKKENIIL